MNDQQLRDRVWLPVVAPVATLAFIAAIVGAIAVILLNVGHDVAVAVAIVVAANVLFAASFLAYRDPDATMYKLSAALGVALFVVAGFFAFGQPLAEREEPAPPPNGEVPHDEPGGLTVIAENISFDTDVIHLPAGQQVSITLDNRDSATPHNISIYTDDTMAEAIFVGDLFNGPAERTYEFTSPAEPGTYFFVCDVHIPTMQGDVIVE